MIMTDKEVPKRGWVKNAAIVFLAAMLVLTFFSNTIMNRMLPEVHAQYTQSGTITARIRGQGTVVANEIYDVVSTQTRTVRDVRVRIDDEVLTGDVLVVLTGDISAELELAQDQLHELELRLEKRLLELTRPDGTLASANRDIQRLRNSLNEAQRELGRIPYSEAAINQAQNALNRAREALVQAEGALRLAQEGLIGPQRELDAALAFLGEKEGDVFDAREWLSYLLVETPGATIDIEEARQALRDAETERDLARWPVSVAQAAYDIAREPVDRAMQAIDFERGNIDSRQTELSVQVGFREQWNSANATVRMAQQALEEAVHNLSNMQAGADVDASLEEIELRELRREIDEKREEVEGLQTDGGIFEITSMVNGVVREIFTQGNATTGIDEVLMRIEVVDRGYSLSIPVTNEQASRVTVGDQAEVDRGWWGWGEALTATLIGVRNDPQNPIGNRILHFAISGDVRGGQQLNIVMNQRSENFNIIVPRSALRTDANGDFVLVVESRTGPLSNRFIATRANVTVITSDDTNAAVSGELSGWDFVITISSQPVEPGMQIRLADNP